MSTISPPASSDSVFESIHAVMHLYRAAIQREVRARAIELTHLEHKTLGYFARHPGATLSELVARTGRDKAQLARIVKDLRGKGLLDACQDAGDRRSTRLTPSKAGRAAYESVAGQARVVDRAAVAGLDDGEIAALLGLLQRVRRNLETLAPGTEE